MNKKELISFLEKTSDDLDILKMYLKEYDFFKSNIELKKLVFSILNYEITVDECTKILKETDGRFYN